MKKEVAVIITELLTVIIAVAVGALAGYVARRRTAEAQIGSAEDEAKRIVEAAGKKAETKQKEALLEAKEEIQRQRQEFERDTKERRSEIQRLERRTIQKEENLDRKLESIEKKEEGLARKEARIDKTQAEITELYEAQKQELERVSRLSSEEARYHTMLALWRSSRRMRHDLSHHMTVIAQLAHEGSRERLTEYLDNLRAQLSEESLIK